MIELDRAAVDHPHDAARPAGHLVVVGDEDDGRAAAVQVGKQLQDDLAGGGVEAARRLVREDQARPVGERARHRDLLLLAARQPARAGARATFEADQLEQVACPPAALLELDPGQRQRQATLSSTDIEGTRLND